MCLYKCLGYGYLICLSYNFLHGLFRKCLAVGMGHGDRCTMECFDAGGALMQEAELLTC